MKPYKVIAYEPGAADVIDRATGERVGYVLNDFHGHWWCYLANTEMISGPWLYRDTAAHTVWSNARILAAMGES